MSESQYNEKKMSEPKYNEKLNMTIVKEAITKDIENSLIKEEVSNNIAYNDIYNKKISNEIVTTLLKENETLIKNFIGNYNKTVENLFQSLQMVENIKDNWIKSVYVDSNDNLHIGFEFENLELVLSESPKNLSRPDFKEKLERYEPEVSVFQNGVELFKIENIYGKKIIYEYNPKAAALEAYKLDDKEYPINTRRLFTNYYEKNVLMEYNGDLESRFKSKNATTALQAVLHEQFITPLENFINKEKNLDLGFFHDLKMKYTITLMFDEYKKEVKRLSSEAPLTKLLDREDFSVDMKSLFQEKIRKMAELNEKDKNLSESKVELTASNEKKNTNENEVKNKSKGFLGYFKKR